MFEKVNAKNNSFYFIELFKTFFSNIVNILNFNFVGLFQKNTYRDFGTKTIEISLKNFF